MKRTTQPTSSGSSSLPLTALFETFYLPQRLASAKASYIYQFRHAIRQMSAVLGREAQACDFTRPTMIGVLNRLATSGLAALTVRNIRRRLWQLWAWSHDHGFADERLARVDQRRGVPKYCKHPKGQAYVRLPGGTKKTYLGRFGSEASKRRYAELVGSLPDDDRLVVPTASGPTPRPWNEKPAARGSVLHFYRAIFRPQLAPQVAARELSRHDCAINHFHDWLGTQIPLTDVTPELVVGFAAYIETKCLHRAQRSTYVVALKRILRASPIGERFPALTGASPKTIVGERERELADLPADVRPRRRLPIPEGQPGTLLNFLVHEYLPERPAISRQHHNNLLSLMRELRLCFGRDLLLSDMNRQTLNTWKTWLWESGVSDATVKNKLMRLLCIWRQAHVLDVAGPVPIQPHFKLKRHAPDAWTIHELQRIVAIAGQAIGKPRGGIPTALWWRAIILTGYYSALRRRALLALRLDDVDLQTGYLIARADVQKNGREQSFRLADEAIEAIRATIVAAPGRELLFPASGNLKPLSKEFGSIITAAGVPKSRRPNGQFHKLRRTAISHVCAGAGMAAAVALAGHQGSYVTDRYLDRRFMPHHDCTVYLPRIGGVAIDVNVVVNGGPTP